MLKKKSHGMKILMTMSPNQKLSLIDRHQPDHPPPFTLPPKLWTIHTSSLTSHESPTTRNPRRAVMEAMMLLARLRGPRAKPRPALGNRGREMIARRKTGSNWGMSMNTLALGVGREMHVRLVDCMEFWIMDLYCSQFLMILNLP